MSAYILVDIEVTNPTGYEEYKRLAAPTVQQYGGRYIVRGGAHETMEGDWKPNRFVILEFPSSERARAWLHSPICPAHLLRHKYARSKMILVEGI